MTGRKLQTPALLIPLLAGCATEVEKAPSSLPVPQQWRNESGPPPRRRQTGGAPSPIPILTGWLSRRCAIIPIF